MTYNIDCVPPKFKQELDNVEKWLKFQNITKFKIFENHVDIHQNVKLIGVVGNLPFKIRFVDGNMDVSQNPMNNFSNMPDEVTGDFKANGILNKNLEGIPRFNGSIRMDNCKFLVDISQLQGEINGDVSFYGCSIRNLDLTNTSVIKGSVNISKNGVESISSSTKVRLNGTISLSDNLIMNPKPFMENIVSEYHDFSGNPCKASDEFDTDCNW